MQRFFDVFFSALALLALSPPLILVMLILRFTGEGEVFYRQQRVGKGGEMFGLYKFATMLKDSPNIGTGTITIKDDPRVLPFGKFLRKTKINELPQLLNILKGDMSVIGPRPQTRRCFDAFPKRSQDEIIKVRPGLSGVGSVAFRGEEDMMDSSDNPDQLYDQMIMPYKGLLEEWYVANHSIRQYFTLIIVTVWVVLLPSSRLLWRLFPELPAPPERLKAFF